MIYLIILLFLVSQSLLLDFFNDTQNKKINFWWRVNLVFFIGFVGLRWEVGGDSIAYQRAFESSVPLIHKIDFNTIFQLGWEPGFILLISTCKSIIDQFWFFQLVHATFINCVIFSFLRKNTNYPFFSLVIYFFFNYLYFNAEVLREAIAVCLFIFMFEKLKRKQLTRYYLLNVIAICFHYSSLALLFIPLLSKIKFSKKNILILLVLACISPFVLSIIQKVIVVLPFADRVLLKIDSYLLYNLNINGTIFKFLCFVLFPYWLISSVRYKDIFKDIDLLYMPFIFFGMIYVMYSGFGRLLNYFIPFMMVFLAQYIYMISTQKRYKKVKLVFSLLVLIPPLYYKYSYYTMSTDHLYPNTVKYNIYHPYSSIFEKETYFFRRVIYEAGMQESHDRAREKSQ